MSQEQQFSPDSQVNFIHYDGKDYVNSDAIENMPESYTKDNDPIEVTDAEASIIEDHGVIVRVDTEDTIMGGGVVFEAVIGNEYLVGFVGTRPPRRPL